MFQIEHKAFLLELEIGMVKRHEEKISQAVTKFFIYLIQSFYIFHSHYSETPPLCMDRIILQHPVLKTRIALKLHIFWNILYNTYNHSTHFY
jgi:hypothetical protein